MFHFSKENWDAMRYGEYMPDATRAAPKAAPVTTVSIDPLMISLVSSGYLDIWIWITLGWLLVNTPSPSQDGSRLPEGKALILSTQNSCSP